MPTSKRSTTRRILVALSADKIESSEGKNIGIAICGVEFPALKKNIQAKRSMRTGEARVKLVQ